jgi:L,D-peptidoglycan transpeptidase YkuD (ErfK/YbiS/YcfS/YnhG family)
VVRRLGVLVTALVLGLTLLTAAPAQAQAPTQVRTPSWAKFLPKHTDQVVRTVTSHQFCRQVWCTVTQAWERDHDGGWTKVRQFRSTIGTNGWGKRREGDGRSPNGLYRIKVTFSTGRSNPGEMPWRRRRPTSVVSASAGSKYNTWVEVAGVTSGDRPSMRWGWVVDYNHVRLHPGRGRRPVPGKGSGIFYHTSKPGHPWAPTAGCTQVGNPRAMHWLIAWLRPEAHPRIVQNR